MTFKILLYEKSSGVFSRIWHDNEKNICYSCSHQLLLNEWDKTPLIYKRTVGNHHNGTHYYHSAPCLVCNRKCGLELMYGQSEVRVIA